MSNEIENNPDQHSHKPHFQEIRTLCLSFPKTSERISHGASTFFFNEKKSFVQYHVSHHGDGKIAIWCAAPPGLQSILVESDPEIYYIPAYVGHLGWVGMRLDRNATWEDIAMVIEDAYLSRTSTRKRV